MSAFDPKRTCSHGAKSRISLGLSITLTAPGGDVQRRGGNGRPGKRRRRTNRPKARKASSTHATIADLQGQLDGRTRERDEALEQWAATTEVLKVISHSTFDLQTVLASVVGSAGRLCRAENVQIFLRDGEVYRLVADNGFSPEYQQYAREHPIRPGRNTLVARTALEGKTIYIPDVFADPEYTYGGQKLLFGGKRTFRVALHMSAFDPKRTLPSSSNILV
jgi:hypothetical protein